MRPVPAVSARLAVGVALLLLGCRDDAVSPRLTGPTYAVSDGAHDGNPDFFFLPPLFKNPSSDPDFTANAFNPTLRPAVEICQLGPEAGDGSRECVGGPPVKRFAPEVVTVHPEEEHYQANWNTDETALDVTQYYRIRVLVGAEQLGFADIDPVSSGKDLKSVETGEYIGLVDGRTLPIKFRIENRALCGGTDCAAETINLATGGGITLTTETETYQFDIPAGTEATFGGQPVTDVTFNLETCEGIAVDLPVFGECLRITTFFTVEGASGAELVLSNGARISMCIIQPGLSELQERLITLHQQDGALVRALPHFSPNCETLSATPSGWRGLAVRGWRWARTLAARAVTPKMLHARSRAAVFNLGGGGETDRFGSTCDGGAASGPVSVARPMLVDCPPSSAPMMAAAALRAGAQTLSDFQFALPAKMDYVNPDDASRTAAPGAVLATAVKVTDWNGEPVQGAIVTFTVPTIEGPAVILGSVPSNSDGVAEISWTIAEGANALVASGRGIAAQNNYPEAEVRPFMPDIALEPAAQQAVALGTGRITFSATGEAPLLGSWARTGALPAARRDHSATLLDDGTVLIIGGTASGAYLYIPSTGAFIATEGSPVFGHTQGMTATKLLDGRVLTVGGGGAGLRAQIYDPSNGSFTETANPPTSERVAHSATLLSDGRVLLAGGQNNVDGGPLSHAEAEIFDPAGETFTPVGDLNDHRYGHAATLLSDGRVLVVGGSQATEPGSATCLASAELFDPETGSFSLAPGSLAEARCALVFTGAPLLNNGKVLVIGWFSDGAELFDPVTETFSSTDDMSIDRTAPSATVLADGRVLVAGGTSSSQSVLSTAEIYDPALGVFIPAASLITGRLQHSGTRLLDGRVLVVGGAGGEGDLNSAELFSLPPVIP